MAKKTLIVHPKTRRQLKALGERLRAARLRRDMSQTMLAERIGVTRPTVAKLEDGDPSTSIATLMRALTVLGLNGAIDQLAVDDALGRELQDAQLDRPSRARRQARNIGLPKSEVERMREVIDPDR